jgi:biuret amidohydrolase
MSWKTEFRSFYYEDAPEPDDPKLDPGATALLVIDVQNTYLARPDPAGLGAAARERHERWTPFHDRMHEVVIPNTRRVLDAFRGAGIEVMFARVSCLTKDGRDRSLSQKRPGWNYLLLPKDEWDGQLIEPLAPQGDEIEVLKTTDSALTGTNLRMLLHNVGIRHVVVTGLFTDQCVSSTVRSLSDESFDVIVLEDCCAAATDSLHRAELEIINLIYCHVMGHRDLLGYLGLAAEG